MTLYQAAADVDEVLDWLTRETARHPADDCDCELCLAVMFLNDAIACLRKELEL